MASEHADVMREGMAWLVGEPIEAEVTAHAGPRRPRRVRPHGDDAGGVVLRWLAADQLDAVRQHP